MSISAIIPAAGQSKRMGQPKLLLPWGSTTVLGKVIETVQAAGIEDILVVTGGARNEVEKIITNYKVRMVYNENFEHEEMLGSIQLGLSSAKSRQRSSSHLSWRPASSRGKNRADGRRSFPQKQIQHCRAKLSNAARTSLADRKRIMGRSVANDRARINARFSK